MTKGVLGGEISGLEFSTVTNVQLNSCLNHYVSRLLHSSESENVPYISGMGTPQYDISVGLKL